MPDIWPQLFLLTNTTRWRLHAGRTEYDLWICGRVLRTGPHPPGRVSTLAGLSPTTPQAPPPRLGKVPDQGFARSGNARSLHPTQRRGYEKTEFFISTEAKFLLQRVADHIWVCFAKRPFSGWSCQVPAVGMPRSARPGGRSDPARRQNRPGGDRGNGP